MLEKFGARKNQKRQEKAGPEKVRKNQSWQKRLERHGQKMLRRGSRSQRKPMQLQKKYEEVSFSAKGRLGPFCGVLGSSGCLLGAFGCVFI